MLQPRFGGYWSLFYCRKFEDIRDHFAAGGTVKQLEYISNNPGDTSLTCDSRTETSLTWSIKYDSHIETLKLLLKHGAVPNELDWDNAIGCDRYQHVEVLLEHGFVPPKSVLIPDKSRAIESIKRFMCRRAVLGVLLIASRHKQPLFHMWKIIARKVWDTKLQDDWLIN